MVFGHIEEALGRVLQGANSSRKFYTQALLPLTVGDDRVLSKMREDNPVDMTNNSTSSSLEESVSGKRKIEDGGETLQQGGPKRKQLSENSPRPTSQQPNRLNRTDFSQGRIDSFVTRTLSPNDREEPETGGARDKDKPSNSTIEDSKQMDETKCARNENLIEQDSDVKPYAHVQLSSVLNLRSDVQDNAHAGLTSLIRNHV